MRRVYLIFHGLGEPGRTLEAGEAPYWLSRSVFEDILALAHELRDRVETRFTFDDGNLSDLTIGAEGLNRIGAKAAFFVLSDRIGEDGSLAASDIRHLQDMGHLIGLHGASHRDWTKLDPHGQRAEMDVAREKIQDITGQPVTQAAIPFGRYNRAVLSALQSRGYSQIYSSDGGAANAARAPIPRTSPRSDMPLDDIENVLLGREGAVRPLRRILGRTMKRLF